MMGPHCHQCKQTYIEQYTVKTFFTHILRAIDLQKRFFLTLFLVVFWPRKIVNEYGNGLTIKYINPVSLFLIIIGFAYLLPEFDFLQLPKSSSSKTEDLLEFLIPVLVGSYLTGLIPFMKSRPMQLILINFYFGAGLYLFFFTSEIIDTYFWKHSVESDNHFLVFIPIFYALYYYINVFGIHIHKMLTNFIVCGITLGVFYYAFFNLGGGRLDKTLPYHASVPKWVDVRMGYTDIPLENFKRDKFDFNPIIIADFTNDGYNDVFLMLQSADSSYSFLSYHYLEGIEIFQHFEEVQLPNKNLEKISFDTISQLINLNYSDSRKAYLQWNGRYFSKLVE